MLGAVRVIIMRVLGYCCVIVSVSVVMIPLCHGYVCYVVSAMCLVV